MTTKYKLVPVEPTQKMIDAGRTARAHPIERYKAMLAAAPEFDQEPVAWIINHSDWSSSEPVLKKNIAERYESDQPRCTIPLYLHPQKSPEVAKLVEALERIKGLDSMAYHSLETAKIVARNALATYRKQVGEL